MKRRRTALAAALLTATAGLASMQSAQPATAHPATTPSPDAPTAARSPGPARRTTTRRGTAP